MKNSTKQTLKKNQRLSKARKWYKIHKEDKHLLRNYRKAFHVDVFSAISDLKAIGVHFDDSYVESVKKSEQGRIESRRLKKLQKEEEESLFESDETFAYIVGYTSGGAPYGITWEEWEEIEKRDKEREKESHIEFDFDDLPF